MEELNQHLLSTPGIQLRHQNDWVQRIGPWCKIRPTLVLCKQSQKPRSSQLHGEAEFRDWVELKAWEAAWGFYRSPNKAQSQARINWSFINTHKTTPRPISGKKGCSVVPIISPHERISKHDPDWNQRERENLKSRKTINTLHTGEQSQISCLTSHHKQQRLEENVMNF